MITVVVSFGRDEPLIISLFFAFCGVCLAPFRSSPHKNNVFHNDHDTYDKNETIDGSASIQN